MLCDIWLDDISSGLQTPTLFLAQVCQNLELLKCNLIVGMVITDEAIHRTVEVNFIHPY